MEYSVYELADLSKWYSEARLDQAQKYAKRLSEDYQTHFGVWREEIDHSCPDGLVTLYYCGDEILIRGIETE